MHAPRPRMLAIAAAAGILPRLLTPARDVARGAAAATNPAVEQDAALLAAVRRRRGQASRQGCEPPLLDVGLDVDEAHLPKVDVHRARPRGAHGREEILRLEHLRDFLQLLAVAREEDGPGARPVADADDVAAHVGGAVRGRWSERLVEAALAKGEVGEGCFVVT